MLYQPAQPNKPSTDGLPARQDRIRGESAQMNGDGEAVIGHGFSTIHTFALTLVLKVARCRPSGDGLAQIVALAAWVNNVCDLPSRST